MNISNRDNYTNIIYSAIVVNTDTSMDPLLQGRIQIYIPDMQTQYTEVYQQYIKDNNKSQNANRNNFPWAVTLVSDLRLGDEVYINTIQNKTGNFIILGKAVNSPINNISINTLNGGNLNGNDITELTMPAILHEEIGIAYNDYPNNITDSKYGNINGNDNGALSIGLIQWHRYKSTRLII